MEGYNTELKLRIDWSEMDLFGHVNNVSFFKYVQAARVNYWEKTDLTNLYAEKKMGPMLASSSCQFKKPLFYPGNITVVTKVGFVKTTSFSLQHLILNEKNEIAAEAEDIVVFYDFNKGEKLPLSKEILNQMSLIEKRDLPEIN
jgi:acyl-CoA thioester hydrolase